MIEKFMSDRQLEATIDWKKVREILENKTGVPTLILEMEPKST